MAELKCKVEDMVILVESKVNAGSFGTVVKFLGDVRGTVHDLNGELWVSDGPTWHVRWAHPIASRNGPRLETATADSRLKPIRGPQVPPKAVLKTTPLVKEAA